MRWLLQGSAALKRVSRTLSIGLLSLVALLSAVEARASDSKLMVLTFDDLPYVVESRIETPRTYQHRVGRLADGLSRAGIPAVGFVNEQRLYRQGLVDQGLSSILEYWLDDGLELGNHTFSHVSANRVTLERFSTDVLRGEEVIRPMLAERGEPLRYFRYPYLQVGGDMATRDAVGAFLKQHGYTIAPVTINTNDWVFSRAYDKALNQGDEQLAQRVLDAYLEHTGAMLEYSEGLTLDLFGRPIPHVLGLHANRINAENLSLLLARLRQHGYRFIELSEALQHRAYRSSDNYFGPDGESWLFHWATTAGLRPLDEPAIPLFVRQLAGPQAIYH